MLKQAAYIVVLSIFLILIFKRRGSIVRETFHNEYDFIIVGGGTTGAAVAGRLAETDSKVLVIEAGDEDFLDPLTSVPLLSMYSPGTERDWQYMTEPQKNACKNMKNNQIRWPRGKILGGTSSLNYMIFARGHKEDYESWERSGADGWGYERNLPYFKKSENYLGIPDLHDSPHHGYDGRVKVRRTYTIPASEIFMQAAEENGFKRNLDYNGDIMEGFAHFHQAVKDGYRQNSATAYLRPIAHSRQDHLHIVVKTKVIRVLFDEKKTAIGVEVIRDGKRSTIKARKEVIVSGGAVETPHILMLSGIGPKKHLQENKIKVISDLSGVGSNLEDHVLVPHFFYSPLLSSDEVITSKKILSSLFDYLWNGWGVLSGSLLDTFATIKFGNSTFPQSQLYFIGLEVDEPTFKNVFAVGGNLKNKLYDDAYDEAVKFHNGKMFSFYIASVLTHSKSRGWIRLNSTDPFSKPLINPNYFDHPDDIKDLIKGMKVVTQLAESKAFKKKEIKRVIFYKECLSLKGDAKYECIARHETYTTYHPCCTAKMGKDKASVVDNQLRVYGVKHLRVADASVMPHIVTGPMQATCYMIAERLADMIKSDWKL